jgi:hypothetical protein
VMSSGWYFTWIARQKGQPFVTSFDCHAQVALMKPIARTPGWRRRPLDFYLGGSLDIYRRPYFPAGFEPRPRFFPVLLATAFGDYWNFGYAPRRGARPGEDSANGWAVRPEVLWPWRLSVAGGTLIALFTVAAWATAARAAIRRRNSEHALLLAAPALALAGLLHYNVVHPFDAEGLIKATYLQFGCLPAYGLFGVAVTFLGHRRPTRPLALLALAALGLVALYTVVCRWVS